MRWSLVLALCLSVGCVDALKEMLAEPEEDEEAEEENDERKEGQQQGDCLDGEDNDDDGDIDCDDSGCFDKPACQNDTGIVDTGEDTDTNDTDTDETDTEDTQPDFEDDCGDNIDNDGDGMTDCEDTDCVEAWECDPSNIDNDGDGYTVNDGDCNDSDASVSPGEPEREDNGLDDDCDGYVDETQIETGADCDDGQDNDLDGVSDCDDPDCAADSACVNVICEDTCVDTWGFGLFGANNGQCEDGGLGDTISGTFGFGIVPCALGTDCSDCAPRVDNDEDGHEDNPAGGAFMWDCDDTDPNVNSSASEVAGNGIDDDCDGTVDNSTSSSETDCSNGQDDDSDGDIDCDDSDCATDPNCQVTIGEVDCTNGVDDDGDGDVDCDDSDCVFEPSCGGTGETDCSDGVDNDGDGYIDCQDSECFNDPNCPTSCPSGEEPDCNGNCAPSNWIGDGYCDNGAYSHNGVAIYFDCSQFNNDGGDCPP